MLKERGVLLLEVMLVLVLLSAVFPIVARSLAASLQVSACCRRQTSAILLADDLLVSLLRQGLTEEKEQLAGDFAAPYSDYRYEIQIRDFTDNTLPGVRDENASAWAAEVVVYWGRQGNERRYSLETVIIGAERK